MKLCTISSTCRRNVLTNITLRQPKSTTSTRLGTPPWRPHRKCCRQKVNTRLVLQRARSVGQRQQASIVTRGLAITWRQCLGSDESALCNSLKTDAPAGTIFACTDSGWIDSDCYVMWLKHFIKSVNSSMDNNHLFLLDGHASHTNNNILVAIRLVRDNVVTMLLFPPHTTHKMQPLDVSFFRSLKNWYNIEIEKFLRTHSGQAITVHQVSNLVNASFLAASTMSTAVSGFQKAGIWPCNRHVFDG